MEGNGNTVIALRMEFLAGRFHANPWERGTNDCEVDWPPAPWRLLRAITTGWYRAGEPDRAAFLSLLDRLTEPPLYLLPRASAGHTRHSMPPGTVTKGESETTPVLDSFIALEPERESVASAYAVWHVDLTREQRAMLERCCALAKHLGRSGSRCKLHVTDAVPIANDKLETVDLTTRGKGAGPVVRRLAAGPSLRGEGLLAALSQATAQIRGAVCVEYRLPSDFLMVREQYNRRDRMLAVCAPAVLRFMLERGKRAPKPSITDAVVFGELMRAAAIKRFSDREGEPATRRLAGKAEDGSAREGHDHPYFLPFDGEGRGEIDGIDVWFPHGCTHPEYMGVTSVSALYEHVVYNDRFPITFVGVVERARSRAWRSATPVVLDRFPKTRGSGGNKRLVDAPEEQIAAMIVRRLGASATVEIWQPGAFRRTRVRKASPPLPIVGATLHFDEPVEGPIVLGRLAHFGLGRFEPMSLP